MNLKKILLMSVVTAFIVGCSSSSQMQIADDELGLSKMSVFDTPTPEVAVFSDIEAGELDRLPVAYSTLPPQVGHTMDEYLPITLENNDCADCHDRRKHIGREWKVGKKLPMPDNHYGSFNSQGGVEDIAGARYNCTLCHVQMSDAQPLVDNTF